MAWKIIGIPKFPTKMGWAIIFLLVVNAFAIFGLKFFEPIPYKDVELVIFAEEGTHYRLVVNFKKTDCTFVRMSVIGYEAGVSDILSWRDNFGLPTDYDREEGSQTLDIDIMPRHRSYDWVEVRTRHLCNGDIVDKVFIHLDLPVDLDKGK